MKLIRITTTLFAASLLFACNNNKENSEAVKETSAEVKADTTQAKPEVATVDNSIEIYKFKGAEPYINTEYLKNATEQEKALIAYYCYFFSTSCTDTKHCKLTEALGLGEQNSKAHKDLVLKWFTDDETKQLVKDGGRATADSDKNKSWYEDLKVEKKGDLVMVRYESAWSTPAQNGKGKGTDDYQFEPTRIKVVGRQHEDI